MSPFHALLLAALVAFAAKTLAWTLQRRSDNANIVDPIWAWTLASMAPLFALLGDAPVPLRMLLAVLGALWGLRLGLHLFQRSRGKPEDWRYAKFRERWGAGAQPRLFWFFQFQNLFTLVLAATAFAPVAWRDEAPGGPWIVAAMLIWLLSVAGEALADRQMQAFRANPDNHGKVCRDGLWRYSRHPNYFFECLHWAAYVPLGIGGEWGALTLVAPLVMALLLMKLSGVPMMEAEMRRRKPGYADYMRETSALVPLPPRRRR